MISRRTFTCAIAAFLTARTRTAMPASLFAMSGFTAIPPRPGVIAMDAFPHSLCIGKGADAGSVIVSCGQGVTALKVDPKSGAILKRAPIGPYPSHNTLGVCSAFDRAWAADIAANQVAVVDFAPATPTVARMNVGASPRDCAQVGSYIVVTESAAPSITAYDPATLLPVAGTKVSFPSGAMPYRMRYDGSRFLYLTDQLLNKLYEVDTQASPWAVTGTWSTGTNPWAVGIGQSFLYVPNVNGQSVTVIGRAARAVVATWPLGSSDGPHDVLVLKDAAGNEIVAVDCAAADQIRFLDGGNGVTLGGGTILASAAVQSDCAVLGFDPTDGGWLYNTNAVSNTISATRLQGLS